ncbi:MAG: Gfo/Idh/MocA family oxidoreductase [Brachybacterium sp.]|nr:Gfo/Idh/MocA family oxidoreductase [Brachybacterium sp.]
MNATATAPAAVPIALVGSRGFGRVHLEHLQPLLESGVARLVAVVDTIEPEPDVPRPVFRSLTTMMAELPPGDRPEAAIIATPIGTHRPLTEEALMLGLAVYVEKPPAPSLEDHLALLRASREAGLPVQVGFQARGGEGVGALQDLVTGGDLGEPEMVHAHGAWTRTVAYYDRSPWAGKRMMDGQRVADGVVTNPLAHGVDIALLVAGITSLDDIDLITTELRRAHDIECDDTSFVRVDSTDPATPPVVATLTTISPEILVQLEPWVEVRGSRGRARLYYTTDRLETEIDGAERTVHLDRTNLVENLLAHLRDPGVDLLGALETVLPFSAVLEATQSAPEPTPIDPALLRWVGEGPTARPELDGLAEILAAAARTGRPFSESGAPFADRSAVATWTPPRARSGAGTDADACADEPGRTY